MLALDLDDVGGVRDLGDRDVTSISVASESASSWGQASVDQLAENVSSKSTEIDFVALKEIPGRRVHWLGWVECLFIASHEAW